MRFSCAAIAVTLVTLPATHARADAQTVTLADGSVYAGELVEMVPSDHITIKLATGEIRRFEWTALAPSSTPVQSSVDQGKQLALATTVTGPPPLPAEPAHVDVTTDTKGALLMKVETLPYANVTPRPNVFMGFTERTVPVCYAPCSADIDANAAYFVTGAYVSQTRRFALPAGSSRLSIRTGNSNVAGVGGWMLAIGVMSTIFASIEMPVAFVNATGPWDGWRYVGTTALIAGGALMLLAIPFVVAGITHASVGDIQVAHRLHVRGDGAFTF
jgi:hypothetical protein